MSKKIFAVLSLVIVMTMVLAACGGGATPTAAPQATAPSTTVEQPTAPPAAAAVSKSVGIVLPTKDEPRWIQDEQRFKDAFAKLGVTPEILFSQGSSATEKQNVETLLAKGVKVIILTPQDGAAAAAAADEIKAAGGKLVSYDRLVLDTDAVDYYVTFDSNAVGAKQGQFLVDNAKGTGLPLYLYAGAATDNNAFLFFEGAWEVLQPKIADGTFVIKNSSEATALKDKPKLTRDEEAKIIGQITTNWDFATAKNLAESNLTKATAADKGEVFILAPNDGTSRSIADTFAADKDVTKYWITGQDAEKPSIQYIIDGKQSMTVLKDVRVLVNDAITAAAAFLAGQTPEKTTTYNNGKIDVPAKPSEVVTVTKDNLQQAIFDSGYYSASDFQNWPPAGATAAPAATEAPAAAGPTPTATEIPAKESVVTVQPTGFCDLPENAGKTYKLTMWHQWSGDYYAYIKGVINAYTKANPCITIDLSKPDDVQSALKSAVPAGQGPDIIGWANDHIGDLSLLGVIAPLDTYKDITADWLKSVYVEPAVNGVTLQGEIWALPETQEGIALVTNNATGAKDYIPSDPKDFKGLLDGATKFMNDKGFPLICNQGLGGSDAYHAAPVYFGFGVPTYVDETGKAYMDTPEAIAAATWIKDLSAVSLKETSDQICTANLVEGKVGAKWTGPWAIAGLIEKKIDFSILPFGSPFVGIKTVMLSTNAVTRGNDLASLDFMKWYTSAPVQAGLAKVNKTIPAQIEALKDPAVQADPVISAFSQALLLGKPMANHVYASAQWVPVGDATLAVWQGKQTPEEAMKAAQKAIEDAVAKMK